MNHVVSKEAIDFMQPVGRARTHKYRVLESINFRGRIYKPGRTVALHENTASIYLKTGKIIQLPRPRFNDILKHGYRLPEKVVLLGSGPNGKNEWNRITKDDFVIALNGALTCKVPKIDLWAAMDPTLNGQKYFRDLMLIYYRKYYQGGYDLTQNAIGKGYPVPVMEMNRVARYFPWVRCTFELRKPTMMNQNNVEPHKGYLRPGCTICGAMVQMCYWLGAKKIILCGIDMFGNLYHDGSKHKKNNRQNRKWGVVGVFNSLMRNLEDKGIEFFTLSETKLSINKLA